METTINIYNTNEYIKLDYKKVLEMKGTNGIKETIKCFKDEVKRNCKKLKEKFKINGGVYYLEKYSNGSYYTIIEAVKIKNYRYRIKELNKCLNIINS